MTKQKLKMAHYSSENRTNSKEIIHSGQFMVSEFEAEAQDDEEDISVTLPVNVNDDSGGFSYPASIMTGLATFTSPAAAHGIDNSLTKLFHCMSLAYRQKLTSPKWNQFKGLKLRWKEKIRLNNIIWRAWHMQFILKYNSSVCQFASPLDVDMHTKPEAIILEGKYWKRSIEAVIAEYKKWRMFSRNKIMGKYKEFSIHDDNSPSGPNYYNNAETSNSCFSPDDDLFIDFNDTLFTLIPNQPFQFPNPREIARGASIADFIQPGLVQFQPNLNDPMDIDPIQELLASKLATVEEEECNLSELNGAIQMKSQSDPFQNCDHLHSFTGATNLMDIVQDSLSQTYNENTQLVSKAICNSKLISDRKYIETKDCIDTFDSIPSFCPDTLLPTLENCVGLPVKTKFENIAVDQPHLSFKECFGDDDTKKCLSLYDNIAAFQSSRSLSLPSDQDSARQSLQQVPRRHSSVSSSKNSGIVNLSDSLNGSTFTCDSSDVSLSSQPTIVSHPNYYLYPVSVESPDNVMKDSLNLQSSSVESLFSKDDSNSSKCKSRIRSWSVSSIQSSNSSQSGPLRNQQRVTGKKNSKLFDGPSFSGSLSDIEALVKTSQSADNIYATTLNQSKLFPSSSTVADACIVPNVSGNSNSHCTPVPVSSTVGTTPPNPGKQFRPKSLSERVQYKEHRRVCHINAEQKRRCNIKYGFDTLHNLVPSLRQSPTGKVSKAVMLQRASDYITVLKSERELLSGQIDHMKQQIDSLNQAICSCQSRLPATGAPVCRPRQGQVTELYSQYVRQRTTEDWKFWIFSSLFEPMLESFNSAVSTNNLEELCRSTLTWVDQHCSLVVLRPAVLNSLRQLSTTTSILSDPSRLPEEAIEAVNKGESSNKIL